MTNKKTTGKTISPTQSSTKGRAEEQARTRLMQDQVDKESEGQLALDIYQTPNLITIVAPIAGVKMTDMNVSVTDDVLTIKGKRYLEFDIPEQDYFTQECFWGDFSRSIVLPASVDTTKIGASFKDAVLKISIPKTEQIKTKVVRIKQE